MTRYLSFKMLALQRSRVAVLSERANAVRRRHKLERYRFYRWIHAFGRPETLGLAFTAGALVGFAGKRSGAGSGRKRRLLKWLNTGLLFVRLRNNAQGAEAPVTGRPPDEDRYPSRITEPPNAGQ